MFEAISGCRASEPVTKIYNPCLSKATVAAANAVNSRCLGHLLLLRRPRQLSVSTSINFQKGVVEWNTILLTAVNRWLYDCLFLPAAAAARINYDLRIFMTLKALLSLGKKQDEEEEQKLAWRLTRQHLHYANLSCILYPHFFPFFFFSAAGRENGCNHHFA